jgi:hypothetical protein
MLRTSPQAEGEQSRLGTPPPFRSQGCGPLGSALTISPARIKPDPPPADGTDQILPPAEKHSVFPSGEEADLERQSATGRA